MFRHVVLANASFGRPRLQRYITHVGGVHLLLNQCQADPESPLAREWALWGIRNLCAGSEEARIAIEELQRIEVQEDDTLNKAGLQVIYEEDSGRLRIKKKQT